MKLITLLLFLLPVAAFSQDFNYNLGGPVEKNYYSEIPFENINGKLFLETTISGKKHRFLLDTGAPLTISKELAAELKAKIMRKAAVEDAYLHVDSVTMVNVSAIKLGDITFKNIPAIAGSPDFFKCYGIDGIIGSNVLRNSIVSIDNNRHLIIITNQKVKLNLDEKNAGPLQFKEGLQSMPIIKIVMDGRLNMNIAFDTGDDSFIRVDSKSMDSLKKMVPIVTVAKGYGASELSWGGMQKSGDKYLYKVLPFTVGNGQFYNLTIESDNETIPAIGSKLLNYGIVTLDYINSKFYYAAYNPMNDLGEKLWPIKPTFIDNKFVIGVVWDRAKLLVKQGEQIMAINDKDYSNATICDLLTSAPSMGKEDQITLTLKNTQGEIRKVKITRR